MSKYQVGDVVLVRSDLNLQDTYFCETGEGWDNAMSEMLKFRGKAVTISKVDSDGYNIEEELGFIKWNWTDEMFSGRVNI